MLLLRLGLTVVTLGLAETNAPAETPAVKADHVEPSATVGADPGEGSGEAGAESDDAASAAGSRSSNKRSRRKKPARTPKMQGWVAPEGQLRSEPPPRPSGNLHLWRLADGDQLKVNIYNTDGSYNVDAVKAATHILRCKRTNTEKAVDPRLLAVLSHVYDHFGERRIEIVSGFRNQQRTTSFHYKASASDIRVAGIKPATVRAFVETLDAGGMGIGFYPRSQFVHVDVRPLPSFRWIDYSTSDPDSPDKRPPRVAKKKRLQS
jgi:uncharacterized protein YcbK (DUF882 family)